MPVIYSNTNSGNPGVKPGIKNVNSRNIPPTNMVATPEGKVVFAVELLNFDFFNIQNSGNSTDSLILGSDIPTGSSIVLYAINGFTVKTPAGSGHTINGVSEPTSEVLAAGEYATLLKTTSSSWSLLLNGGTSGGSSSASSNTLLSTANSGQPVLNIAGPFTSVKPDQWLIIEPYSTNCEFVKVQSILGTAVTASTNLTKTHATNSVVLTTSNPVWDIKYFGAKTTETATNNRLSIQAAIDNRQALGGGVIFIPKGEFIVNKAPGIACFVLTSQVNIFIIGAGINVSKITLEAGSYPGDTSIFSLTSGTNVVFENLTFFGNRFNHTVSNEQMHGVRLFDNAYARFYNVRFDQIRGDGVFLLGNTSNSKTWITNCEFYQCGRSGVTIQRLNEFLKISGSYFEDINDQAIDSEPTGGLGYNNTIIDGNFFTWTTPRGIGVTLGGSGSTGIKFINNIVKNATVHSTSLSKSEIINNQLDGALSLLESADDVKIAKNRITSTGKCINIYYQNDQPRNFVIEDNTCKTSSTTENIIEVQISGVVLRGNKCYATNAAGTTGTGILVSAPILSEAYYDPVTILDNEVYNCNTGITISASSSKKWLSGRIINNTIKDLRASKTIQYGINLSGPAFYHFDDLFIDKNSFDSTLTQPNQIVLNSSGCSWYKITSTEAAGLVVPEGVVSGQYNSTYNFIGYPYKYTKTVDGGTSGWVEKNIQLPNVIFDDSLLENPQATIDLHTPTTSLIGALVWVNDVGQHSCLTTGEAVATALTSSLAIATINTGLSNCIIQSLVRTGVAGNEYSGLVFRLSDSSNYWAVQISAGLDIMRIIKVEAGVLSVVSSGSLSVPASGELSLRVELRGNTIAATYNGGSLLTAYSSFNVSETKHGMISGVVSRYYFQDFKIAGV